MPAVLLYIPNQPARTSSNLQPRASFRFIGTPEGGRSGYAKVRYRGLAKRTARLTMLFVLGNLWAMRHRLLAVQG